MEVWTDIKNYEGMWLSESESVTQSVGTGLQHIAWHTHSHIVGCQARTY